MGKRLISVLLFAVLLVGLLPAHASAAETSGKIPDCDLTWTLEENGKDMWNNPTYTLKISGNGAMKNFNEIGVPNIDTPWNNDRTAITAVVIGNGVTTIGNRAFSYCNSLTSVTISDSVTTIGQSAFEGDLSHHPVQRYHDRAGDV